MGWPLDVKSAPKDVQTQVADQQGWITSVIAMGCIVGAAASGPLADWWVIGQGLVGRLV
jgi:MFS family permease